MTCNNNLVASPRQLFGTLGDPDCPPKPSYPLVVCGYPGDAADQREGTAVDPATPGYAEHRDAHLKRLRRIEGQVRGIHRMVEEDRYCIDILTQVSAATSALQSAALALLEEHLAHCVADAVREGGADADTKVAEASAAIARLVRS
jgi:DNA-binding FrmR family transcriptional regulator